MRLSSVSLILLSQLTWGSNLTEPQVESLKKLYHFNHSNGTSEFSDLNFYVHPDGTKNFEIEIKELINGFENPQKNNPSYSCLFPARQKRLEKFLNKKFPLVDCPDLNHWRENLKSTHLSLLFSGAYSQNPASLFGHTLFRISNRADPLRKSELLSYVVGFLASTGDDESFQRIRKGLTGQYPGYYNLEPFYIKLGLYNNSESRDVWEVDLNFSQEEIDFFIDHLWEISRFAKPYYFIKRNCSFHLLRVLEAIRPELKLVEKHGFETLPHESVRTLIRAGLTQNGNRFYPSLKRKMVQLLNQMSPQQIQSFKNGKSQMSELQKIDDPIVLDTLIFHWQIINYQNNLKLDPTQKSLMEMVFRKRAMIAETSNHNQMVSQESGPQAPYEGHSPHQLRVATSDKNSTWISYRHGVHGFNQNSLGFDDFSSIEYLGIKYQFMHDHPDIAQYQILFADIRSFESTESFETKKSWLIEAKLNSRSFLNTHDADNLSLKGGIGFSKKISSWLFYSLILADSELVLENNYHHGLRLGGLLGFKIDFGRHRIILESEVFTNESVHKMNWGYTLNNDNSIYLSYQPDLIIDNNSMNFIYELTF